MLDPRREIEVLFHEIILKIEYDIRRRRRGTIEKMKKYQDRDRLWRTYLNEREFYTAWLQNDRREIDKFIQEKHSKLLTRVEKTARMDDESLKIENNCQKMRDRYNNLQKLRRKQEFL